MSQEKQRCQIESYFPTLKEARWWILAGMVWGLLSPLAAPVIPFYDISVDVRNILGSALSQFIAIPFILITVPIIVFVLGGTGCLYGINWKELWIFWPLTVLFCGLAGYILRAIVKAVFKK